MDLQHPLKDLCVTKAFSIDNDGLGATEIAKDFQVLKPILENLIQNSGQLSFPTEGMSESPTTISGQNNELLTQCLESDPRLAADPRAAALQEEIIKKWF